MKPRALIHDGSAVNSLVINITQQGVIVAQTVGTGETGDSAADGEGYSVSLRYSTVLKFWIYFESKKDR